MEEKNKENIEKYEQNIEKYECYICNKKLINKYSLKRHEKNCSLKGDDIEINGLKCEYCDKEFSTKYTLINHIKISCKKEKIEINDLHKIRLNDLVKTVNYLNVKKVLKERNY